MAEPKPDPSRPQGRAGPALGLFALAALVGGLGGALGVGFQNLVTWLTQLATGSDSAAMLEAATSLSPAWRLIVPAAGGLVAGLLLLLVRRPSAFGITEIVELVATRRERIRGRSALVQIASSAVSIGTGSSIGKEGPNSQIAATIAEFLARVTRTSSRHRAVLLGCGVAAGMSTSYGAPIAGALFVMEVVLGNFAMDVFAPVVVAAVVAKLVVQAFLDVRPIYEASVSLSDDWRLVLAAGLLGVLCAFGSLGFRRTLEVGRSLFLATRLPLPLRLALGGLIVGAIGIWYPEVWGNGYDALKVITTPPVPGLEFVLMLVVWKTIATAASTGSGALGGIFTPNLVVGGVFGSLFGNLVFGLWPQLGDHRIAFALVGMAGLCSATTHAPITAILLIFEMTDDYQLILPLMLCSIAGSGIARILDSDSIYTARLRARGHDLASGIEKSAMQVTLVRDLLRRDTFAVRDTAGFDEVMARFHRARTNAVYVVDEQQRLLGHIQLHDIKYYINDPSLGTVVIAADLTRPAPIAHADETIAMVLPRFDDPDLGELAVVDRGADRVLLGRITRRDIVALLSDTVVGRAQLRARLGAEGEERQTHLELPARTVMKRMPVPDAYVGRTLGSLDEFEDGRLVAILVITWDELGHEVRRLAAPNEPLPAHGQLFLVGDVQAVEQFGAGGTPAADY